MTRMAFRTCPLCEATCGLQLEVEDGHVTRIRGDADDPFSQGFICPKGSTLGALHEDPDRLRRPLVRRDGAHVEVSWDEAFAEIDRRLTALVERARHRRRRGLHRQPERAQLRQHARDPAARQGTADEERLLGLDRRPDAEARRLRARVRSPARDPRPRHRPHRPPRAARRQPARVERQPGDRARLARPARGDPAAWRPGRRRRSAADEDGRARRPARADPARHRRRAARGNRLRAVRRGPGRLRVHWPTASRDRPRRRRRWPASRPSASRRSPACRPTRCAALARELAAAPTAVVYGRIGTHTTAYGTLAAWLVDVLNVLTGNLDRPGGAMFPHAAHEQQRRPPRAFKTGRLAQPGARAAGDARRAPRRDARRRDGDAPARGRCERC